MDRCSPTDLLDPMANESYVPCAMFLATSSVPYKKRDNKNDKTLKQEKVE